MAKGEKSSPELITNVMTSWCINKNNSRTARELGIPESTVRKIVKENKDKPEYVELCDQKRDEFSNKASIIIDKLLERITNEVDNNEKEIPLHHLTTAIGTLYDKRALSRGEMTQNVGFATNLSIDKLAEISGYKKEADTK